MGTYLNSITPYTLYKSESLSPYFVDKTLMLSELFPYVSAGNRHICITRPRRFGKTIMANMISSFFQKASDSSDVFDSLTISQVDDYRRYKNQYNVIRIDFSKMPRNCDSYTQYIERIEALLIEDVKEAFPQVKINEADAVGDILESVFVQCGEKFIFVLDEWDFIFHRDFINEIDKEKYVAFLSNLLKDRPYVVLSYMTGILPIAKYSSGSELNMFAEFTMVNSPMFGEYFGFTDDEVDDLYRRYIVECDRQHKEKSVTRKGLRDWYNGYYTKSGERVYNPRSVVFALQFNNLANYWTSSGPYDEIYYYIRNNISDVRDDLALMISGESVTAKIQEYAATSMNLSTRDEIYSAMVVYGFLSYLNGKVCIPNRELMEKFDELLVKNKSLGYVYRLAKESEKMLKATLAGDTLTMERILEFAHNTEVPLLSYNHETELSAIVNLVYLAARDSYRVEREDKAGTGYVDFIFYPYDTTADCIILELKVDHTPDEAIAQIIDKKYALKFMPKLAGQKIYTGRILAVGIGYWKESKKHSCKVEEILK
ncbi:AAA family ATPase [Agathobacter rectalis]|uniref:AAA family ATPase n=1 Tax=Agathobacter rectalis TaxID=39491 RepID=A0A5S4VGL8_9FIRM|nr:AAA family ATPase [Agathobacter rectalis]TYL58167.1 AAA family ATPase [Agathobacter rectalis]